MWADDPGSRVSLTRLDGDGNYFGRTRIPGSEAHWLLFVFFGSGGGLQATEWLSVGRTRNGEYRTS